MTFEQLVQQIRVDRKLDREVPGFDPGNGNESAKYLFLLEAPGPRAVQTGIVSLGNPDPTARNLRRQLQEAGIGRHEIALWNVVPWYLSEGLRIRAAREDDLREALPYMPLVVNAMPDLRCIVLVGRAARRAHILLSATTDVRILACHHPSARAMNANRQAERENIAIFRFMKASSLEIGGRT